MRVSKFRCRAAEGFSRMLKVRQLPAVLVITVFFCSVQIAAFHHHDSFIVHRDCPICKFLAVSSSGGEAAVHLQPVTNPDFGTVFFALENLLIFLAVMPVVRGTRAPPQTFFPEATHGNFRMSNYLQSRCCFAECERL